MWIATEHGFYSAVEHRNKKNTVIIRARVRQDLVQMINAMKWKNITVVDSPSADYPHRIVITKKQWAEFVTEAALGIDYPNFKSRVGKHDPERAYVYHDVWADLMKLEKGRSKKDRWHHSGTLFDEIHDWDVEDRWFDNGFIADDEPWLCPDCDETLVGYIDRCPWCHCEIEWVDQEEDA